MKRAFKIFLIATGLIFLVLFSLPIVVLWIRNAGNIMGIIFSVTIIFCGLFLNKISDFFRRLCKSKPGKIATGALCTLLSLTIAFVIYSSVLIAKKFSNPPSEATTVVVLGCKVNPNGPSTMLKSRIDAACRFLKENPESKCIASGGMGSDEVVSEARCIFDELTSMGIDPKRIYIEDKATSTKENIEFSKDIIEEEKLPQKITIITNEFHQYRASVIASELNMESFNVSGRTPAILFPTYFLREIGGVLYEMIF